MAVRATCSGHNPGGLPRRTPPRMTPSPAVSLPAAPGAGSRGVLGLSRRAASRLPPRPCSQVISLWQGNGGRARIGRYAGSLLAPRAANPAVVGGVPVCRARRGGHNLGCFPCRAPPRLTPGPNIFYTRPKSFATLGKRPRFPCSIFASKAMNFHACMPVPLNRLNGRSLRGWPVVLGDV